jgi:hypothetical protein
MEGFTMTEEKSLTHHVVMGVIGLTFLVLASFSELFMIASDTTVKMHEYGIYWLSMTGMGLFFMGASVVATVFSWDALLPSSKRVVLISVAAMIGILLFQILFQVYQYLIG